MPKRLSPEKIGFILKKMTGKHPDPETEWGKRFWDKYDAAKDNIPRGKYYRSMRSFTDDLYPLVWRKADKIFPELNLKKGPDALGEKWRGKKYDEFMNQIRGVSYWLDSPEQLHFSPDGDYYQWDKVRLEQYIWDTERYDERAKKFPHQWLAEKVGFDYPFKKGF